MQKYKYAFDLEENLYSLNLDFDTYKLSSDEINKIHSNPILDDDSNYIEKEIVYDHTYIYLAPKEFIEQYKLSNEHKIELYNNIEKIKIKDITPENIKDISFIFHYILQIKLQEDADVQGYEMPISSYWQCIPFNQRMNIGIENVFRSQDKAIKTQRELDNYISINPRNTLSLSDSATNILNQNLEENETVSNFNDGKDNTLSAFYGGLADLGFTNISSNTISGLEKIPDDASKLEHINEVINKESSEPVKSCISAIYVPLILLGEFVGIEALILGVPYLQTRIYAESMRKYKESYANSIAFTTPYELYDRKELKDILTKAIDLYPKITEPRCEFVALNLLTKLQEGKNYQTIKPVLKQFLNPYGGAPMNTVVLVPTKNGFDIDNPSTYRNISKEEFDKIIVLYGGSDSSGHMVFRLKDIYGISW